MDLLKTLSYCLTIKHFYQQNSIAKHYCKYLSWIVGVLTGVENKITFTKRNGSHLPKGKFLHRAILSKIRGRSEQQKQFIIFTNYLDDTC